MWLCRASRYMSILVWEIKYLSYKQVHSTLDCKRKLAKHRLQINPNSNNQNWIWNYKEVQNQTPKNALPSCASFLPWWVMMNGPNQCHLKLPSLPQRWCSVRLFLSLCVPRMYGINDYKTTHTKDKVGHFSSFAFPFFYPCVNSL